MNDKAQPPASRQGSRNVIVLVESSAAYGRACAQGIARYARNHGQWLIRLMPHDQMPVLDPNIPWKWEWDGVIARIANQRLLNMVRRLKLPTVDIIGSVPMKNVAVVDADHHRIIELAMEHLLSNGLRHLAFCGVPGLTFSDRREAIFMRRDCPSEVKRYAYQMPGPHKSPLEGDDQRWLRDLKAMRVWLEQLPKPVGIVACNDTRARHMIEVCMAAGLEVPRDVAVIGIDNDDVICELSTPTLTSIDPNAEAIGYEAARVLDEMMEGGPVPDQPLLIPPLGVERRGSTNVEAFNDDELNQAIRFIREHCDQGINVGSVVSHVGLSRSTLERRFNEHLDCTIHEYIHRLRMDRVQRLLLETNYPAAQIAKMTGFGTNSYFGAMFRKHTGLTPGQFRRQQRTGA